jgi:hypothetical protein
MKLTTHLYLVASQNGAVPLLPVHDLMADKDNIVQQATKAQRESKVYLYSFFNLCTR